MRVVKQGVMTLSSCIQSADDSAQSKRAVVVAKLFWRSLSWCSGWVKGGNNVIEHVYRLV